MAEVLAMIEGDTTLRLRCRSDMMSAMRTLRRVLGTELSAVPTAQHLLRQHLEEACPVRFGVTAARWCSVRSLVLGALIRAGVPALPGRSNESLSPEWARLSGLLPDAEMRFRLSRFMRFCSTRQVEPGDVVSATFERFHEVVQSMSVAGKPNAIYRTACIVWNKATGTVPGWPRSVISVPSFSRRYALGWEGFPAAFGEDCRRFLNQSVNQDVFADDYTPAIRPSTIDMRRKQILQLGTALVLSGVPASAITGLACLVTPENARRALGFFRERPGGRDSKYLHQHAVLLKTIARHWVKAPVDDIDTLRSFASRIAVRQTGMVEKNRAKLRQFDDPENVLTLLRLPRLVFEELESKDAGLRSDALRAMFALAVRLLVVAPMRVSNLVNLQFGRHILTTAGLHGSVTHLRVPTTETKKSEPFEALLRADTVALMTRFTKRYRNRLSTRPSSTLFASQRGDVRVQTVQHCLRGVRTAGDGAADEPASFPPLCRAARAGRELRRHRNGPPHPRASLHDHYRTRLRRPDHRGGLLALGGRHRPTSCGDFAARKACEIATTKCRPVMSVVVKVLGRVMPLAQWLVADRQAWGDALTGADIFDPAPRPALRWRPITRELVRSGYGRWLAWLDDSGLLGRDTLPASRITRERVAAYKAHLALTDADYSVAGRVQQLGDALRAMAPRDDWGWILRGSGRLRAMAEPAKDKRLRLQPPEELAALGLDLIHRAETDIHATALMRAKMHRDGLIISLLVRRPIRAGNLGIITLGEHLERHGSGWTLSFTHDETKPKRHLEPPRPECLLHLSSAIWRCIAQFCWLVRAKVCRRQTGYGSRRRAPR